MMTSGLVTGTSYKEETTLDANALLSELDKGLRSSRTGEQCEAIVRFPWLIESYPFPILINTASLKLAEVFRNGSNFSRLLVLKTLKHCEKHLDKILNIDEFVHRLFTVTHSNDPVARSITLRALGEIAVIVPERKSIHHCLRNSLDSRDELEVVAAIEASASFARKSPEFAMNIYPKVLKMMNGPEIGMETKVRLLTVLRHTHFSSDIALDVRKACVNYLAIYSSQNIICNTLNTLTFIASNSLTQVPEHIELLFHYLINDPRLVVKRIAINELTVLARKEPHLWTKNNANKLLDCMSQKTSYDDWENAIAKITSELVKCPCLLSGEPQFLQEFHEKAVQFSLSIVANPGNSKILATCIQILVSLSINSSDVRPGIVTATVAALRSYIISGSSMSQDDVDEKEKGAHALIFRFIMKLVSSHCLGLSLVPVLHEALVKENLPSFKLKYICETLLAVSSDTETFNYNGQIFALLGRLTRNKTVDEATLCSVFTLYFHISRVTASSCSFDLLGYLDGLNQWTCYRIARQAMRYGHHELASNITKKLFESSSSETSYFWMMCLSNISRAESMLPTSKSDVQLNYVISLYIEACSMLRASITPSSPMAFQCEYTTLRYRLLQAHLLFRESCRLLRTAPAPAVAAAVAQATRDDLLRCGTVVVQMRKCAKEFRTLADAYSSLFQSSFNADNGTLGHVQLLQSSCTILAEAIESLFMTNRLSALFVNKETQLELSLFSTSSTAAVEHKELIAACHDVSDIIRNKLMNKIQNQAVDSEQIAVLHSISERLVAVPLCIPRLFFQCIQTTCIKLAVSPQQKIAGDLVMISTNSNFTLKIEGVVVTGNISKQQVRKVAKVMLNVTSTMLSKAISSEPANLKGDNGINVNCVVIPHNDYFQTQILLSFSDVGIHTLSIEASIIDENDAQWKTGPIVSTSVKVIEDGGFR